ncbi:MAG: hypothetical protein MZW92_80190 [Comamonadaceae bacterium]|nr:hypothetical protein [Comamonadaceae bacterium]
MRARRSRPAVGARGAAGDRRGDSAALRSRCARRWPGACCASARRSERRGGGRRAADRRWAIRRGWRSSVDVLSPGRGEDPGRHAGADRGLGRRHDAAGQRAHASSRSRFTKVSALGVEEQRVNVIADFVDPPGVLGDGYRVEARVVIWSADKVLKVPVSALFRDGEKWSVFVVEGERARCAAGRSRAAQRPRGADPLPACAKARSWCAIRRTRSRTGARVTSQGG